MATPSTLHSLLRVRTGLFRPGRPQSSRLNIRRQPQSTSRTETPKKADPELVTPGISTANVIAPPSATLPLLERLGPITRAGAAYGRSQRKRPYITQICTSLVIYLCADISAQQITGKDYDPVRTVRSLIIGTVASIPAFEWFVWLSSSFNFSSKILSLGIKIIINQFIFTPAFATYFFGMQALLAGESVEEIWHRISTAVPISSSNAIKFWPFVMAVNFSFVPIEYRSAFAGVFAVIWQTYLTWLNRMAEEGDITKLSAIEKIVEVEQALIHHKKE